MNVQIIQAKVEHLEPVAVLFDLYRQFYGQPSDLEGARRVIGERLQRGDSIIFVAVLGTEAIGFVQLFPSFSSAWMQRTWIMNDVYVLEEHRKKGISRQLVQKVIDYGRETGAKRLTLNTLKDNLPAQKLYESMGWRQESVFWSYTYELE